MENVPPLAMNGDDIPSLDDLLHHKRNVKASRQKRSLALNSRTNADNDDGRSEDDSGLLTPPSSQQELEEDDMDPARMLFSPPPEEVLRGNGRSSVSTPTRPTAIGSPERSTVSYPCNQSRRVSARYCTYKIVVTRQTTTTHAGLLDELADITVI